MLAVFFMSLVTALLFVYLFMPSVWMSLMAVDEYLDAHESGKARVASRNPFRENGPPACMAKLIMLRHKMHQTDNRKRRPTPHARQASRSYTISLVRHKTSWMRFRKPFGKQYH